MRSMVRFICPEGKYNDPEASYLNQRISGFKRSYYYSPLDAKEERTNKDIRAGRFTDQTPDEHGQEGGICYRKDDGRGQVVG